MAQTANHDNEVSRNIWRSPSAATSPCVASTRETPITTEIALDATKICHSPRPSAASAIAGTSMAMPSVVISTPTT